MVNSNSAHVFPTKGRLETKTTHFSKSHSSDVLHEQLGVFPGEVVEEPDLHDRIMAEEVQLKRWSAAATAAVSNGGRELR